MNRIVWRAHLIALISVVVATLLMLPMRETLTLANITMIFLLLVVLIAVTQGTAPALVMTFASFFRSITSLCHLFLRSGWLIRYTEVSYGVSLASSQRHLLGTSFHCTSWFVKIGTRD